MTAFFEEPAQQAPRSPPALPPEMKCPCQYRVGICRAFALTVDTVRIVLLLTLPASAPGHPN